MTWRMMTTSCKLKLNALPPLGLTWLEAGRQRIRAVPLEAVRVVLVQEHIPCLWMCTRRRGNHHLALWCTMTAVAPTLANRCSSQPPSSPQAQHQPALPAKLLPCVHQAESSQTCRVCLGAVGPTRSTVQACPPLAVSPSCKAGGSSRPMPSPPSTGERRAQPVHLLVHGRVPGESMPGGLWLGAG